MTSRGRAPSGPSLDGWAAVAVRPLLRGVNLSHWYGQVYDGPGYVDEHFAHWITDDDLALVAGAGFDHVRLPVAYAQLRGDGGLDDRFAARVVDVIARLHAHGLAVVVDVHPEVADRDELAASASAPATVAALWREFAPMLAGLPVELTALEVMNEPGLGDAGKWSDVCAAALSEIRQAAPRTSVVLSGDGGSEIVDLLRLRADVLVEANTVLNFHLYDPQAITHQSAHFAEPPLRSLAGLAYPPDVANIVEVLAGAPPESLPLVAGYVRAGWNTGSYRTLLALASGFAAGSGHPLTCNEFGVYRGAPRPTRLRWLAEISAQLAEAGIGWTMWDYAGDFRLAEGAPGSRHLDRDVLAALRIG